MEARDKKKPVMQPLHWHSCACGNAWCHGSESRKNYVAHTCSVCNRQVWRVDLRGLRVLGFSVIETKQIERKTPLFTTPWLPAVKAHFRFAVLMLAFLSTFGLRCLVPDRRHEEDRGIERTAIAARRDSSGTFIGTLV